MIEVRYKFELFIDMYKDQSSIFYGKVLASHNNNDEVELVGTAVDNNIDKVFDRLKDIVWDSYKIKGVKNEGCRNIKRKQRDC